MTSTPTTAPPSTVGQDLLVHLTDHLDEQALLKALNLKPKDLVSLRSEQTDPEADDDFPFENAPLAPEATREMQCQYGSRILLLVQEQVAEVNTAQDALKYLVTHQVVNHEIYTTHQQVQGALDSSGHDKELRLNQPTNADLSPSFVYDHEAVAFELGRHGLSVTTLKALHAGFVRSQKTSAKGFKNRLVFQVRGVSLTEKGLPEPVIYSHLGLATNQRQAAVEEWSRLRNFTPWQEIYNQDNMVLREGSLRQAREVGHYILVPTIWDVAWLWENGIFNCGATFDNMLNDTQVQQKLALVSRITGVDKYLVMFDRSKYCDRGNHIRQEGAVERIRKAGLQAEGFEWLQGFGSGAHKRQIPYDISSPSQLDAKYLSWFRKEGIM